MSDTLVTHLLDTSALLAYYRKESGWERVHELIFDRRSHARVSALSWLELQFRLVDLRVMADEQLQVMKIYRSLLGAGLPVDDKLVAEAGALRHLATARLPTMDALIAATAAVHGAVLVHRDVHMEGIPDSALAQLILPENQLPTAP